MDNWRREWRQAGAGVMGATFLVGGTWISASNTFVASQNGQLIHPSPWGYLLWICIAGFFLAAYAYLATYWSKLPMFGRTAALAKDSQQSLKELNASIRAQLDTNRPIQIEIVGQDRPIPLDCPNMVPNRAIQARNCKDS